LAQAAPYALVALVLPLHAAVWEALLFFTGVWSTSIHDTTGWEVPGVLGARHHLLHHTHFRCNYGQFTQACDWLAGTGLAPLAAPPPADWAGKVPARQPCHKRKKH